MRQVCTSTRVQICPDQGEKSAFATKGPLQAKFTALEQTFYIQGGNVNAALRRHHDAIQQLARDEWPASEAQEPHVTSLDDAEVAQ